MYDSGKESSRPPLILIASAEEWSGRSLEALLGPSGFAVVRAFSARQARELVHNAQPDALIVDARIDDSSGIELVKQLRTERSIGVSTPVIVRVESYPTRTLSLAAFEAGAWEVCHHPVDGELLMLRLTTFVQAKRAADAARDESLLDAETGVYNLRGLARRAREIGAQALRTRSALACVALAPDTSEADSDESAAGRPARTSLALATALVRSLRASDVVGHLGRSEFAVIAPATTAEGAEQLLDRVRKTLESTPVDMRSGQRLKLRGGYCAVPDYSSIAIEALDMLERASSELRVRGATLAAVRPVAPSTISLS